MRIDTSEPSLTALFEKGQVGLIRTEFMRKDDIIDSLVSENAHLKAEIEQLTSSVNLHKSMQETWKFRANKMWEVNERLRNAGDWMLEVIRNRAEWDCDYITNRWLAAKEGKPSV